MKESRFPELDTLRGCAVLLMVLYHAAFDLEYFWHWPVLRSLGAGGWLLARTAAILFLIVAGICFTLSWERTPALFRLRKVLKRFLVLASAAALVSFATWLIAPQDFVKFGILHLFALSTLLLPLFAPLKHWNILPALLIFFIPTVLTLPTIHTLPTTLAVLLGSPPQTFSSLDYFPLIPWFGFLLLGLSLGHSPYFCKPRVLRRTARAQPNAASEFIWLASAALRSAGRHSLIVYLLHQPLLLALLSLILGRPPPP